MDFNGKKVLVVDDNSLNLIAAQRIMASFGLQVSTCTSGQECETKLVAGEVYDLIFLDDMMPSMSGVETLGVIKKIPGFKTRVIALTANTVDGAGEKYKSQGFADYLAKPIKKDELEKLLINNFNAHDDFAAVPKEWLNISDEVVNNFQDNTPAQPVAPSIGGVQPVSFISNDK